MSDRIRQLKRAREKSWLLRISAAVIGIGVFLAWITSRPLLGRLSASRRWENFQNFVEKLVPRPVRDSGDWGEALPWAGKLIVDDGWEALGNTLGIATAAILISAASVILVLPFASRALSRPDPLGLPAGQGKPLRNMIWRLIGPVVRLAFVLARAVPEYLLAFLLLSLLGPQVGPLILALAIHNFGILGRLWSEVVENAPREAIEVGIATGQGRVGGFLSRIFPESFNRFLIYFFYRWETCVKDATVLGMLGLLTLGKLIALSKGFFWDRMLFYVLMAAVVILIGDALSTFLRRSLR
ncbi:MAG: ABC transporter permease subunit [Verrucomicrobiota bacterium]